MKKFSKNDFTDSAICNYCGKWKPTDLTPQELEEMDWKCAECKAKEPPQSVIPTEEERGSKEVSKYDPEYEFLVKLIQLVTKEGVPPQEVKALAEAHPFVTIDDVGDLAAQIWTLATEKYNIPREWLIKKLPKNASLKQAYHVINDLTQFALDDKQIQQHFKNRGTAVEDVVGSLPNFTIKYITKDLESQDPSLKDSTKGFYDFKTGTLYINPRLTLDSKRLTIIHEIEHAIQDAQGILPVHTPEDLNKVKQTHYQDRTFEWGARQQQFNALKARGLSLEEIENILVERAAGLIKPSEFYKENVREIIHNEVEQMEDIYNEMMPESVMASKKKADLWPSQEQAGDMLSHEHNSLSYNNEQEADTSVSGPRPDEVGKEAESLNIDQIVQILNAKDTNKVVKIDTKNLSLELSDGTEISFDDAAKKALDMNKTATGEFTGAEFSTTDFNTNPLLDIGPFSSPSDYGAKPQKKPFPNTMWDVSTDDEDESQPASNVAASLKKEAIQQQDVVDFYLLSLLPPEYLNQEVSPDHYDALSIFKGIIESLRNEYIERGMAELVDEAETTAWTKAIPESDMPEEIKKYYTFHDSPFPGRNYSDDEDEDNPSYDYICDNCGTGLDDDEAYFFRDQTYCSDCENKAIHEAIEEDIAYCTTHHVFVTDADDLKDYLHGYKFDNWDNHHDNGVCQVVRFDAGKQIWKEVLENADKQLRLQFEERKKRREEKPKQLKFRPVEDDGTAPNQLGGDDDPIPGPTASLKQAGEGRYMGGDSDGWWEAPTHFGDYTAQDFYTIFEHAPWKHLYGGPAWAEIAKTIYQMEQTTDWQKLVVLIDHFHDLGHNTGKLLDKFPEWHQWFRKLLDEKAKKNSIRYLLPKASKPVQNLVTDFLKIHGRDWREDEGKKTEELPDTKFHIGEQVIMDRKAGTIKEVSRMDLERPLYVVQFDDGSKSRWAQDDELQPMPAVHSSFNRPFSKKAVLPSKFWIAPDGTEFPMGGVHGHWIENNLKKLKQYGIDAKGKNLIQIWNEMIETGWARVSNEPAGTRFIIEVNDLSNLPPYLDSFIAKYYTQGEEITLGNGKGQYVKVNDPFPSIQKAVNKELTNPINASLKQAAIRGDITNKILQAIHNNGGVTYNLTQGEIKEGFVVSTHLDREQIVDGVDFDILEGYIENNQDLLSDPNNSFGAWTNNGKVFLDVVTVVPDKEKALELGREHGQLAIWDLAGNQELYTGVQRNIAFSKKELIKQAEKSSLSEEDQNQIAAKWTPIMNIALNNYSRAVKNGHDPKRALKFAEESVINIGGVKESDLQEAIGIYLKGLI